MSTRKNLRWGSKGAFSVTTSGPAQGRWKDFSGSDSGDPLALIMHELRCNFIEAVRYGCDFAGIAFDSSNTSEDLTSRLARQTAREAEQAAKKAQAEAEKETDEARRLTNARHLWHRSVPVAGTIAETYLTATRAIPRPAQGWPDAIRFHPGSNALIVAATDEHGALRYVHRVRLTLTGQKIAEIASLPIKQTTGVMAGAAVRLPGPADGPLLLAEGTENALTMFSATGFETWAATGGIPNLVPPIGRRVLVMRDDDKHQSPADQALKRAVAEWLAAGINVTVVSPWQFRRQDKSDVNDVIREGGPEAVRARMRAVLEPPLPLVSRIPVERARIVLSDAIHSSYKDFIAFNNKVAGETAKAQAELTASAEFPEEYVASKAAQARASEASAAARAAWQRARAASQAAADATKADRDAAQVASKAARAAAQAASKLAGTAKSNKLALTSAVTNEMRKAAQKLRKDIKAAAKDAGRRAAGPYPVHGIKVDVGAGKTRESLHEVASMVQLLRRAGDKRTAVIAIPVHRLGDEQVDRFLAMPEAAGLTAAVYRSRRLRKTMNRCVST